MYEYQLVACYYGKDVASSGVPLINHIDEGLNILTKIKASDTAKKAFCLHPMFQGDIELLLSEKRFYQLYNQVCSKTIFTVMEYRYRANNYLLDKVLTTYQPDPGNIKDVFDMLVADKVQNRRNFELHYKAIHPKSLELELYFAKWFEVLEITESIYRDLYANSNT